VFDPFGGSFAISCAALEFGLKAVGCEIDEERYSNGLLNLQNTFKKLIGGPVNFT
jgi:tRNA G10  N-methylase Trm11